MSVTSWFPTVIHCIHKVIYYGKMRLAPAQTHYKLKRANRVNEVEMRKACVPKIVWEEGIHWEGCWWLTDENEGVLMYLIKHSSSIVEAPNLQIRDTLSCCPWGSPYSKTVHLVPGGGIKELRISPSYVEVGAERWQIDSLQCWTPKPWTLTPPSKTGYKREYFLSLNMPSPEQNVLLKEGFH